MAITLGLTVFSGCLSTGEKSLIQDFSQNSVKLTDNINQVLDDLRTAQDAYLTNEYLYNGKKTFGQVVNERVPVADLSLQKNILDEVKKYSNALNALATSKEPEEIQKASSDLYDALTSLNETTSVISKAAPPVSKNELRLLAVITEGVGRAWFEYQRDVKIQEISEKADTILSKTVEVFKNEFSSTKIKDPYKHAMALKATYGYQLAQSSDGFTDNVDRKGEPCIASSLLCKINPKFDYLDKRKEILEDALASHSKSLLYNEPFDRADDALEKLRSSHQAMVISLNPSLCKKAPYASNVLCSDKKMNQELRYQITRQAVSEFSASVSNLNTFLKTLE